MTPTRKDHDLQLPWLCEHAVRMVPEIQAQSLHRTRAFQRCHLLPFVPRHGRQAGHPMTQARQGCGTMHIENTATGRPAERDPT
jgi:hypothetical protein